MAAREKYQGKELQEELGLELYDFHARQYDPQIGRFWGLDPLDQFPSGYTGMGNDPANMIDPTGMETKVSPMTDVADRPRKFMGGNGDSGFGDIDAMKEYAWYLAGLYGEEKESLFLGGGMSGQGQGAGIWTLLFNGQASDYTFPDGTVRQIGNGQLHILDQNGDIVESFEAISGPGDNGLLPNGDYKADQLTLKGAGWTDETGLEFKLVIKPVGKLAIGFGRDLLRIHPVKPSIWAGRDKGVDRYTTVSTDGCIGVVGNKNAAPYLKLMQKYFSSHKYIMLKVDVTDNANVTQQIQNKRHY